MVLIMPISAAEALYMAGFENVGNSIMSLIPYQNYIEVLTIFCFPRLISNDLTAVYCAEALQVN